MRKVITMVVCALGAGLALASTALADAGESDRVCRGFGVHGVVQEVGERSLVVAVEKARPEALAGDEVTLKIGSRTRYDGDPVAVGRVVKAHGTVCQVDEADEPVYYTKRVKVKKQKLERPRGSFKLAGVVTEAADGSLTVQVGESNIASFVGKLVTVVLDARTEVEGEPVPGVTVVVAGKARIVGGTAVLLAREVAVTGAAEEDEDEESEGEEPEGDDTE